MTNSNIRVRIAPSPSGYLHVGTARTAIFNFLYARHFDGKFLTRVEDTDVERSDPKLVEAIIDALKWLSIESDEKIVYQSQRKDIYRTYAQNILNSGHGYRCFCTPEELEADRTQARQEKRPPRYSRKCLKLSDAEIKTKLDGGMTFATRLKIPDGETSYNDMVLGEIKRQNNEIEDFIIARSDGTATYNLAVVVDDYEMKISHVIRGNDHITNTFKQIHIYRALGWEAPEFGHVPLLLRPDKKKVSKRLGDKDVMEYADEGVLPEAMFNYLCMLGWSPKTDQEIYTPKELIDIFNPANFNTSNAVFDEDKLIAFNKQHIMMKSAEELAPQVSELLGKTVGSNGQIKPDSIYLLRIIDALKERVRRMSDFASLSNYFFTDDYTYDPEAEQKQFVKDNAVLLSELADKLDVLKTFDKKSAETALSALAETKGVKRGQLIHPTRLAVSGMTVGPGLYDILEILGKEKTIGRIRRAVDYIKANS